MKEKIKLLEKLGFSDGFLKIIEKQENEPVSSIDTFEVMSFYEPIDIVCPDLTMLIISKTSPPAQFIYKSA